MRLFFAAASDPDARLPDLLSPEMELPQPVSGNRFRGRRGIAWLTSTWLALAGAVHAADPPDTAPPGGPVPPRAVQLLHEMQNGNPATARAAEAQLRTLGFSEQKLVYGRLLLHSDPAARAQLPSMLQDADPRTRADFLLELMRDEHHLVRIHALDALRSGAGESRLDQRVREMAQKDADPRVKEFATLLVGDWDAAIAATKAPATSPAASPAKTAPRPVSSWSTGNSPFHKVLGGKAPPVALSGIVTDQAPSTRQYDSQQVAYQVEVPAPADEEAGEVSGGTSLTQEEFVGDEETAPEELKDLPEVIQRPLTSPDFPEEMEPLMEGIQPLLRTEQQAPLGFTGRSSVMPTEVQETDDFVPVEDRWRLGFPDWDRYDRKFPVGVDYPYKKGIWYDPYNQNVLKGDYPIIGQHTFLKFEASDLALFEARALPTPTTPFESTRNPFSFEFFGDPNQFQYNNNTKLAFELFHGNAAFKPLDWNLKLTPIVNQNYLDVEELGVVNPNVNNGTTRYRGTVRLEEYFYEMKLADLSPEYDFLSTRAGSQYFQSDFRGFLFADTNRAVRLFGTRFANRDQFNLIYFDQTEKETNSLLNTFDDRHQNTYIANYYRQDFIFPGYTMNFSYHYNKDQPSTEFDRNDFLVRPDPAGIFQEHEVEAHYVGFAGDGHIERVNISHAYYYAFGQDSLNPIAGQRQHISAHMAALELSYDRDWARFRGSFFFASGDEDPLDGDANGFDTIFDNPNFAGGKFSFWQRQAIKLFGVNLVQRNSLVPDLRSSKFQGQSNFVNPGLFLWNGGVDFDITPKLRLVNNVNYLYFDKTDVLEQFTFQDNINRQIGTDISTGIEYRPLLNNNILIIVGISGFFPDAGFKDLYKPFRGEVDPLYSHFMEVTLTY